MADLRELYQGIILDHNRAPRNYGRLADASAQARGHNPLCGDDITIFVRTDNGRLLDVRFVGSGCAISRASASLMTTVVRGESLDKIRAIGARFRALVTGEPTRTLPPEAEDPLRRLMPLAGVAQFPIRVKCATLAWHALDAALAEAAVNNEGHAR